MFKLCTMSSIDQIPHSSWPSLSFSEDSKEDSTKDSGDEEEASVEEEDKVENQSSVIPVEYLGTTKGSVLMRSVHTVWLASIMLKISLN